MRRKTRDRFERWEDATDRHTTEIKELTEQLSDVRSRLKMLECPHEVTVLLRNVFSGGDGCGYEKCEQCGKILKHYTEEEFLIEDLARTKKDCGDQTTSLKAQLKEERARIKADA